MDLDYDSVRALASPTRLKILNMVLDEEATTTKISDELDKSKSTVSNHLKVLTEAGLLEKDDEEGRRRVIYRPTEKSKAIVEGRERKVKFSIVSSALTAAGGIFLLNRGLTDLTGKAGEQFSSASPSEESAGTMGTMDTGEAGAMDTGEAGAQMATEAANQTSQNATQAAQVLQNLPENSLVFAGAGLLLAAAILLLLYAALHRNIRSEE